MKKYKIYGGTCMKKKIGFWKALWIDIGILTGVIKPNKKTKSKSVKKRKYNKAIKQ
jgi:hypothetical protein